MLFGFSYPTQTVCCNFAAQVAMRVTKYGVLLCYGIYHGGKTRYRNYLDSFARLVKRRGITSVVISGGYTDPARPDYSEADSIAKYLDGKLGDNVTVSLERRSINTPQNILYSRDIVTLSRGNDVLVFCDNIRQIKVLWYVLHYWFGLGRREICMFFVDYAKANYRRGLDTDGIGRELEKGVKYRNVIVMPHRMHTDVRHATAQQIATLVQVESLYDSKLEKAAVEGVMEKFGMRQ